MTLPRILLQHAIEMAATEVLNPFDDEDRVDDDFEDDFEEGDSDDGQFGEEVGRTICALGRPSDPAALSLDYAPGEDAKLLACISAVSLAVECAAVCVEHIGLTAAQSFTQDLQELRLDAEQDGWNLLPGGLTRPDRETVPGSYNALVHGSVRRGESTLRWVNWSELTPQQVVLHGPTFVAAYWSHAAALGVAAETGLALKHFVAWHGDKLDELTDESTRVVAPFVLTEMAFTEVDGSASTTSRSESESEIPANRLVEKLEELDELLREGWVSPEEHSSLRDELLRRRFAID